MKSSLAILSASSLTTHGCIKSGPADLWMSSLLQHSLTWQSFTTGNFLVPAFHRGLWDVGFPKVSLASRIWGKRGIPYLGLFTVLGNQVFCFLQERVHILTSLTFVNEVLVEGPFFPPWPDSVPSGLSISRFDPYLHRQCLCISPRLPVLPFKISKVLEVYFWLHASTNQVPGNFWY